MDYWAKAGKAAKLLQVSPQTIRNYAKLGKLSKKVIDGTTTLYNIGEFAESALCVESVVIFANLCDHLEPRDVRERLRIVEGMIENLNIYKDELNKYVPKW